MSKKKYSLEEILDYTRINGPQSIKKLGTHLNVEDAELLSLMLKDEGLVVEAYDFPGTYDIWKSQREDGIYYKHLATKKLIQVLADEKGVDYTTLEGFKELLPELTQKTFQNKQINYWETILSGMIQRAYNDSPSTAVLDLIAHDDNFAKIREEGLESYDFPHAPKNTWKDNNKPSSCARQVTKKLIQVLAREKGVDYTTLEGFKELLPVLIHEMFENKRINYWGTTLNRMINSAYNNSPSAAVLDLVAHDDDFTKIREEDLESYDFPKAPHNIWNDNDKPSSCARQVTKKLIQVLAREKGVNYTTLEGFKELLPELIIETFRNKPLNSFGTTLGGMIQVADNNSPSAAVINLIKKDDEFKGLRKLITLEVLSGRCKTRKERLDGNYSSQIIRKHIEENILNLSDLGFYSFADGEKSVVREILAEEALHHFGDKMISYFGLEGPIFGSYFALDSVIKIDVKKSLVPERNKRNYNLMRKIARSNEVNKMLNGSSLRSLEIVLKNAEDALNDTEKIFDLIFLDWLGHLSPSGIRQLNLSYSHLNEGGMIAATININKVSQSRYHKQTGFSMQQEDYLQEWAEQNKLYYNDIDYIGGDKIKTPMKLVIMKNK
ncbi:MAG: hypothetical protein Q8R37_05200 [Nanoarchaeota archaeon]|nr:hypothetical protein [Nanoarchaeota archaeon]